MRRKTAAAFLSLCLLASGSHAQSARDDLDRIVTLPQVAQRIVTLAPHATELVSAAGAGDKLVGIAGGVALSDEMSGLPRVAGRGALDREALLALQPDLVIGWQSGNRASDLDWVGSTGIALYRSEPGSLQDIAETLRDIGSLSGTSAQAEVAARRFEQAIDTPCTKLPPQNVYVLVWNRPAMTVGGRHWINSILRAAGYRNVFGHIDRGVFNIAPEAEFGHAGLPKISLIRDFSSDEADQLAGLLSRPGPRLGEAARLLCAQRLQQASTIGNP